MAIKIVTDSTSYIPQNTLKALDISLVSLSVVFEETSYLETELDLSMFYGKLSKLDKLPTSSQPSTEDMYNTFKKHIMNGNSVVGIFLSSEMSGTFSTSQLVKGMILEEFPDAIIELIDSRTNCMEMGFVAIAAAKAAIDDQPMNDVLQIARKTMNCTRFIFAPSTLEFLKKGGRIGNASSLLADILKIKPVLTVKEGFTTTLAKIRTQKKALDYMLQVFSDDIKEYGYGNVIVHHIHCPNEANEFSKDVAELIGSAPEIISIGAVIGTHVGPGTLGIAYCTREPMR
ncbi:MAG: fatty acid-binding protein DegV [Firmicutes bacterium HGW-Firmicutes-1]|jgi:DegV family protein with EDD domain|nr:MAG: fatty acid-binding protein DegV [Firmicutes bacterium HGW-Firmicutes-1]